MKTLAMVSQCASCRHLTSWVMGGDGTTCAAYPEGIPDTLWHNDVDHRKPVDGDRGVRWASGGQPFPAWVFDDEDAAAGGERAHLFGESFVRAAGGDHWRYQWRDPGGEGGGRWISGPPTGLAGYSADWLDDIFDQVAKFKDPGPDLAGKLKLPDLKVLAGHAGLPTSGAKATLVQRIVGHAKGERPVVAAKAPRKPVKATTPRAPAIKDGVWVVDPETGEPHRVPRGEVPVGVDTYPTKAKAALGLKPRPRAPAKPRKGFAYVVDMSNDDNPISRMSVDEVPENATSFPTLKEARREVGRQTFNDLVAEGSLTPEGGPTPAGEAKYGPKPKLPRVDLTSTNPRDNGRKLDYIRTEGTGETRVTLYRKARTGPSGQTTNIPVGHIRFIPSKDEFHVRDRDGKHVGIIYEAEGKWVTHAIDYDGGISFLGRASSAAVAADVLVNGEYAAVSSRNSDSRRLDGGTFQARRPDEMRPTTIPKASPPPTDMSSTLAKAKAKVAAGKTGSNLTETELIALIDDLKANGPSPEAKAAAAAVLSERPTPEEVRDGLKGKRPQVLRDIADDHGIDVTGIGTKAGLLDAIVPVLYAQDLARWMARNESVRDEGEGPLPPVPAGGLSGDRGPDDVLLLAGGGDRPPGGRPDGGAGGPGAGEPTLPGAAAADDRGEVGSGAPDLGGDVAGGGGRRDGARTPELTPVPVFRPRTQADLAPNTPPKRLAANIEALETLRAVQLAGRPATAEEQAKLARWSGWGSLPKVFKEPPDADYADAQARLKALLSPAEWSAARRTIRNAHYTDAALVGAMWDAMRKLGFERGEVLEPGSGSGTFMGMVPEDIARDVHVTGVELDPTTAAIAAALYPNHSVRAESFAETEVPDGSFDAAIGNVPFATTKLFDPVYNAGPGGRRKNNMHNHFILKSLRMTRPGGIGMFITSRYTMDSLSPSARQEMAELADLVGAVRLPSRAHEKAAGTSVVTDLLIFRRRPDGVPYAGLPFEEARTVTVDDRDVTINGLFLDRPDLVLGRHAMTSGLKDAYKVYGEGDVAPKLRDTLDTIVTGARMKGWRQTEGHSPLPAFAPPRRERKPDGYLAANDDGTFTRLQGGIEVRQHVPSTQREELGQLLRLRDTALALIDEESTNEAETDDMVRLRADLNEQYDRYTAKYGAVGRYKETRKRGTTAENDIEEEGVTRTRPPVMGLFRRDPYSAVVRSLEVYDPATNSARKTDIFERRVIAPRAPIDHADNPADALAITLDEVGEVDLERVGDLLGEDDEATVRERLGALVFDEPGTGRLVPRAEYLSGNVRIKLEQARQAAVEDPTFVPNVEALQRVLPEDLTPAQIRAKMGAGWIEPTYVEQFLREILRDPYLTVRRTGTGGWQVEGREKTTAATTEWGTRERNAIDLAMDVLMARPIEVSYKNADGTKVVDQDQTESAQAKAEEMAARFEEWAWEDPQRTQELLATYNRLFNSLALRSYDGTRMELPGMAREGFYEYPHRYQAIRRIINEPSVGLWHEVGAGKTSVMVISAMEMRRLGLVRKPAIVVPNHMLEQMTFEFHERYPQAKLLAIGTDDLKNDPDGSKRRDVIARAATGDWDAVIMTHGAFKRIPVSDDTEREYLQAEVEPMRRAAEGRRAELEETLSGAELDKALAGDAKGKGKDPTLKEIEAAIEAAENRIKEHQATVKRDPGLTFERTGIDYLFVDEAHTYKNLRTFSRHQGLGIPGSGIATDLHMKLHHLRTKNDRVATLATATPIANSVGEAYTMMRYLRPDLLEDMGLHTFDEFAAAFGEVVSRLEVAPTGGLRQHERFARFVNVPEFLRSWLIASDVKTADDLKDIVKVPLLAERVDSGGVRTRTPDIVVVPPSQELQNFIASLVKRAGSLPRRPQKGDDNMLSITGEGRAAALDLRMVGRDTDEPQKLDYAADRIASIYQQNKDRVYTDKKGNPTGRPGALQLVFSDIGTPSGAKRKTKAKATDELSTEEQANASLARFVAYEALRDKLVERGVPREKIKFIHEADSDEDKAKMFAAAKDGRIAVLIGSTNKMGVGTNVQQRAVALHHLDAPWRPADVQQREGRIIRQGNQNEEVQVIRYVTERSFDAYIWQAITTKGAFINQIMRGSPDVREMEDVGDFALSAAEVTALGTGNRFLVEYDAAAKELTHLERALNRHEADQRNIIQRVDLTEANIAKARQTIAQAGEALQRRTPTYNGKNFQITVAGTTFTKRDKAYERLREELRRVASGYDQNVTIGELGGFPIRASGTERGVDVELAGVPTYGAALSLHRKDIGSANIIASFADALDDLEPLRRRRRADIETALVDIEALRARIGRPFADTEALQAARTRFDRVEAELKAELERTGQTVKADDPAAARAARLAALRDKLDAGGGFEHIGEVTSWLEADPNLATEIPSDAGKTWGHLTPRGQLLVMKERYGGKYSVTVPRTMKSHSGMGEWRTLRDAKAFAEALENTDIPWNRGGLTEWRSPDGATVDEIIARLRGERFARGSDEWLRVADRLEARRLMPERFRQTLLGSDDSGYRNDGLGVVAFAKLDREHRDMILALLRGAPEGDLETAIKLREFGLAKDEGVYYSLQRFALAAAMRLERDYRRDHPQPLDDVRKAFQSRFSMDLYSYPGKRARIEQILSQADLSGNLETAIDRLRAYAAELRQAEGYEAYHNGKVADIALELAQDIRRRMRVESLREQLADWSDGELRALAMQHGVQLQPYDDRANILARLAAAGVNIDVAATPAALVDLAGARALLAAFTRVPGGPQWKFQGRDDDGQFTGNLGSVSAVADAFRKLTDAEFTARQERLDAAIAAAYPKLATEVTHRDKDGVWSPERDAIHREIAAELYAAAAHVPTDGVAIIAGGLGGAGKTTVLRDHAGINPQNYVTINPDDVKEVLARRGLIPEIPGHPDLTPMERNPLIHVESGRIAQLVADMAHRDRRNVIWDITMSSSDWAKRLVAQLRDHGYSDVRSVFVDIPVDVSVTRALERYRRGMDAYAEGEGFGGRYVPPRIIRGQATADGDTLNRKAFEQLKPDLDQWALYDNSVHGRAPTLIAESTQLLDMIRKAVSPLWRAWPTS